MHDQLSPPSANGPPDLALYYKPSEGAYFQQTPTLKTQSYPKDYSHSALQTSSAAAFRRISGHQAREAD